ncbi:MAG: hypothetical protein IJE46_03615 [Clostridia bacterium]|nr:hypothetical protein [Clostridia bacterium]
MNFKNTVDKFMNKKVLIAVFLIGILIMLFPDFKNEDGEKLSKMEHSEKIDVASLEKTLKRIDGIDDVDVFISYCDNGTINYAYDTRSSNNQRELEIKMSDKKPVISRALNPKINGVLVVVEGAYIDEPELYSIVKAATGVPLHRICIKICKGE